MPNEDLILEALAKRARAERSLYVAEMIADGIVAVMLGTQSAWNRVVAFARSRSRGSVQALSARR